MFRVGLLALAFATAAFAQQQGGTFETSAPQQVVGSVRPLVSTPTMTLSNGFAPATVTMPQTIVSESPEMVVGSANNMPQGEGMEAATFNPNEIVVPADFNFGAVSGGSAFDTGFAGPSLGEIARQYHKGKVEPHKTYTNDDVNQLTSQVPETGIIYARLANGQPIEDRNRDGFSPMSGIANMPTVGNDEGSQVANGDQNNPMNEGQQNATASNSDQGRDSGDQATTPAAADNNSQPANGNSANQQMPASDNPHR